MFRNIKRLVFLWSFFMTKIEFLIIFHVSGLWHIRAKVRTFSRTETIDGRDIVTMECCKLLDFMLR